VPVGFGSAAAFGATIVAGRAAAASLRLRKETTALRSAGESCDRKLARTPIGRHTSETIMSDVKPEKLQAASTPDAGMKPEANAKLGANFASVLPFLVKVGGVLAACIIFLVFSVMYIESEIKNADFAKGGPVFWSFVEKKLYEIADEKDLPKEKKAKILAALRRISSRYAPYVDALHSK
jgi:hypothetical protein